MTRIRKIRGHRKKWKDIDNWVERCKSLDLNYLQSRERDYVKIWVHPRSGISVTNSEIAQPGGETKKRILQGLIDIHNSWKSTLDEMGEPYYLKIWLFDPFFSRSQVVCAIRSNMNFYETTFYQPEQPKMLVPAHYGKLADQMARFNWDYHWDEFQFSQAELGEPEDYASPEDYLGQKQWFDNLMKKPLRRFEQQNSVGETFEVFGYHQGTVWIGGQ